MSIGKYVYINEKHGASCKGVDTPLFQKKVKMILFTPNSAQQLLSGSLKVPIISQCYILLDKLGSKSQLYIFQKITFFEMVKTSILRNIKKMRPLRIYNKYM